MIQEKLTLPVGILSIKQPFSTGDNVVFAAVVLAILPVLIVFLIGQKWIVNEYDPCRSERIINNITGG